jgi:hypothetical protein
MIDTIPPEIGNLTKLQRFSINSNNIKSIPVEISKLVNLEKFVCSNNKIESIPSEICNMYSMSELILNSNEITELPDKIGDLHNLTLLNVNNNKIKRFPQNIVNLVNLKTLVYIDNPIDYIAPNIERFFKRIISNNNIPISSINSQDIYEYQNQNTDQIVFYNVRQYIPLSIKKIMEFRPIVINITKSIRDDIILNNLARQHIIEFCQNNTLHSTLDMCFNEIMIAVWNRIIYNRRGNDIKRLLNDRIIDTVNSNSLTWRILTVVTCLYGYDENVDISYDNCLCAMNIIKLIGSQLITTGYSSDRHKMLVSAKLFDMEYSHELVKLFVSSIDE